MDQEQIGLFQSTKESSTPLANSIRPLTLEQFIGQNALRNRIDHLDFNHLPHIVFFGPPGCGKTTIAQILAKDSGHHLYSFNAVLGGVNDLRKIIKEANLERDASGDKAIIFIDEIHRFNKGQQDALLPYLEKGEFILFGATTENPNTTLNKAILSRVQRWRLSALSVLDIQKITLNALGEKKLYHKEELTQYLAQHANGDARSALNQLEILIQNIEEIQGLSVEKIIQTYLFDNRRYDKNNERHYDVISAFIKSIRGSDADAAILWLAVMLDGGEDIEFIARRLIILASEDIGNADPRGIQMATSAHYAIKHIGMPEARIILAQATTYLACAPKSNASYLAIDAALSFVQENPTVEVPTHLRNHHPDGKKYQYPHNHENHWVKQSYKSDEVKLYASSHIGYERMQEEYLVKVKNQSI